MRFDNLNRYFHYIIMNHSRSYGYSIVELLASIAISSTILFVCTKSAMTALALSKVDRSESQAIELMSATQAFFESRCGSGGGVQPTITLLKQEGFLNDKYDSVFSLGGTISSRIVWSNGSTSSRIQVMAILPAGTNASAFVNSLGADRYVGQTIYWDETPAIYSRLHNDEIYENIKFLMPGLCK